MTEQQGQQRNLSILAAFLNFRFDDRPEVWDELKEINFGLFELINEEFREWPGEWRGSWNHGALSEVRYLHTVLAYDIEGLLNPKLDQEAGEGFHLEVLVNKVNQMLKPQWIAEPTRDHRWTVKRWVPGGGIERRLYATLIFALETNEFQKFKRCKDCQRLFVAAHLNRKFCPTCDCGAYYKPETKLRMQKLRERKDAALKEIGVPLLASLSYKKLSQIRPVVGELLDEFIDFAEIIKTGESPGQVWDTMPRRLKERIASHAQ